jgi:phosphoribosylformylglycinamidine synthase
VASQQEIATMEEQGHVVFRYVDGAPNGAQNDIAGVTNAQGNVVGLMPHPEHAVEEVLGTSGDGRSIFASAALWSSDTAARERA